MKYEIFKKEEVDVVSANQYMIDYKAGGIYRGSIDFENLLKLGKDISLLSKISDSAQKELNKKGTVSYLVTTKHYVTVTK